MLDSKQDQRLASYCHVRLLPGSVLALMVYASDEYLVAKEMFGVDFEQSSNLLYTYEVRK